jgi:ABC transporter substrate binding protein
MFPNNPMFLANPKLIVDLAAKNRLPSMFPLRDFVDVGGLMFYGPDAVDLFRKAATYVDKILNGRKSGELPVEQPTKFEFVINLKTAKQIGFTIPPSVLARADRGNQIIGVFQLVTKRRRSLLGFVRGTAFSIFLSYSVAFGEVTSNCENIRITSAELTAVEAEEYCRYAASEREKVEVFWGPTWKETIHIRVDSSYRISRALTTGVRGFMEILLTRVREKTSAVLHEIAHIYAPNRNRFLAEGVAVYLQDKLAGNRGPTVNHFGYPQCLQSYLLALVGTAAKAGMSRTPLLFQYLGLVY